MQGYRSEATHDGPENELSGPVGGHAEVRATKLGNDGCGDCDDMPVQVQNRPAAAATSSLSIVDDRRRDDLSHDTSARQWRNMPFAGQKSGHSPEVQVLVARQLEHEGLVSPGQQGSNACRVAEDDDFVSTVGRTI